MIILFYYFMIINTLALVLMGYDKNLAKSHKRRIPEKTLLFFVVVGGTIGSGIAMLFFKHKTAKRSHYLKFFGISVLQILIIFWLLYPKK